MVYVDGQIESAWPAPTKGGNAQIELESGYRVLIIDMGVEPFFNLKVERLPGRNLKTKPDLLLSREFFASEPGKGRHKPASAMGSILWESTGRSPR
jgi:hypothetical protein